MNGEIPGCGHLVLVHVAVVSPIRNESVLEGKGAFFIGVGLSYGLSQG